MVGWVICCKCMQPEGFRLFSRVVNAWRERLMWQCRGRDRRPNPFWSLLPDCEPGPDAAVCLCVGTTAVQKSRFMHGRAARTKADASCEGQHFVTNKVQANSLRQRLVKKRMPPSVSWTASNTRSPERAAAARIGADDKIVSATAERVCCSSGAGRRGCFPRSCTRGGREGRGWASAA
jgi:hypothetical protein